MHAHEFNMDAVILYKGGIEHQGIRRRIKWTDWSTAYSSFESRDSNE